ncbi:MAG TPA: hypothetical protein VHX39_14580 [Acetobacteraceae bacterium]|nr:hypothetical protein [Acetobacteraceae bacterium]
MISATRGDSARAAPMGKSPAKKAITVRMSVIRGMICTFRASARVAYATANGQQSANPEATMPAGILPGSGTLTEWRQQREVTVPWQTTAPTEAASNPAEVHQAVLWPAPALSRARRGSLPLSR